MEPLKRNFSAKARIRSFRYALEGLKNFFIREHNAWIHLLATIVVIIFILLFPCSKAEIIMILLVTGFVWSAELFNTAIEHLADLVTTENHPGIKFIKDAAAAAVFIAAVTALATGCIIFIPKLF